MSQDELIAAFRDATQKPREGSQDKVWRALRAPPAPPKRRWLGPIVALAGCAVLGVGLTELLRPKVTSGQWSDEHSAVVWTQAQAQVQAQSRRVALEHGDVAVSSWGAPLEVKAKGHLVQVESGVALVHVAGESVTVSVVEGVLSFDGTTQTASRSIAMPSAAGALLARVIALESPTARPQRLVFEAERAMTEQRFDDAARAFEEVAFSGSLEAEVANFKQGELELRRLEQPAKALETFEAGEARFPKGALSQERQLSAIESCVKLKDWSSVERRTKDFLLSHASSERAEEVALLHATALAARGDWMHACAELARLPKSQGNLLRAQCP